MVNFFFFFWLLVCCCRRGLSAHASAYDKNPDEVVRQAVVPDDAIQPHSDKYWSPHPTTGVFGPGEENAAAAAADPAASPVDGSVLEETVWFRPLEDVDKPQSA